MLQIAPFSRLYYINPILHSYIIMQKTIVLLLLAAVIGCMPGHAQKKISRQEAVGDIDSLVSLIEEVEVDPYMLLPKERFYSAFDSLKQSLPADSVSTLNLYLGLKRLTGMFRQGHLGVGGLGKHWEKAFPLMYLLDVTPGSHELTVKADADVQGMHLRRGTRLLSINGRKVSDMVADYLPMMSGETDAFRSSGLGRSFGMIMACENPGDTIFDVEMLDGSRKIRHTFRAENGKDMTRPDDSGGKDWKPFEYEMLNDSVMLFTFNSCDTRGFDRFVRKMFAEAKRTGVRHLIIDVRSNGGGNSATGDEVCRYLTDRPFSGFGGSKVRISRPVCEHYKEKFERDTIYDNTVEDEYELCLPYDRAFRFDGKTYLLTSVNTYSSAANFAWEYWKFVPGTVIGEETGGVNISTGDVIRCTLPNTGFSVMLPWKIFYHYGAKDGDQIHGTVPHVSVPASEALDKALAIIASGSGR